MASSKDTFESKTFAAMTFACGNWRGIGVDIISVVSERYNLVGSEDRNRNRNLVGSADTLFDLVGSEDRNRNLVGA